MIIITAVAFYATWWGWNLISPYKISPYNTFAYSVNPPDESSLSDSSNMWLLVIGLFFISAFLISGLLITTLINWFDRRKEQWLNGEANYKIGRTTLARLFGSKFTRYHDFSVVLGGHRMVPGLCRKILAKKDAPYYIVVQTSRHADDLRKEIYSEIDPADKSRIIIYRGDRTSANDLKKLNITRAKEIYIMGESATIDGRNHDNMSMDTLQQISLAFDSETAAPKASAAKTPVHVMFVFQSTFTVFQYTDVHLSERIRFVPFNFYDSWAQQVLLCRGEDRYLPLDGRGIGPDSERHVHLIIVGMSRMGISLAIQAANLCHYPNFHTQGVRTLITFIDPEADKEMSYFTGRYSTLFQLSRSRYAEAQANPASPNYSTQTLYDPQRETFVDAMPLGPYSTDLLGGDLIDIDWEFIKGQAALPSVQKYLADAAANPLSVTTIAICLPETHEAISTALYLPESIYEDTLQILVQQSMKPSILRTLTTDSDEHIRRLYSHIKCFGMLDTCSYDDLTLDLPGKFINNFYNGSDNPNYVDINHITNPEQALARLTRQWDDIGSGNGKSMMASKWSSIYCGMSIGIKCRAFDITPDTRLTEEQIALLGRTEHTRWCIEELLLGFRPPLTIDETLNPTERDKAAENRLKSRHIHPVLCAFDRLPAYARTGNLKLLRELPALLRALTLFD